ncbi:MAG: hypothetical protein ACJA0N_000063 [Pseudohongiellaceae bacterium]|jgi:hypothetical protein
MKNILKKTTLALAIAAVSTGAFAGDLDYTGANDVALTLANEVFGTGSGDTLVAIPDVTFTLDVTKDDIDGTAGEVATVKLTLDSGAVFGEDLSDIDKWADSSTILNFVNGTGTETVGGSGSPFATATANFATITVTQGGAIGDNTVTFEITSQTAGEILTSVRVAGFRVKELTSALERGVSSPAVKLGAEFRNVDTAVTDTDTALTILTSQDGVELEGTLTDYDDAVVGLRARIDVADTELSFTGDAVNGAVGTGAAQDFDETDNVAFVTLGNLQVNRTTYQDGVPATLNVKKEDANDFDFNGSDTITVALTSSSALTSYDEVYLRTDVGGLGVQDCDDASVGADFVGSAVLGDDTMVEFDLSGESTAALAVGYEVCAVAAGTSAIPESSFTASLTVEYFNPRYTDSEDTLSYGNILRNGCQVTLFNVPAPDSPDSAAIRLTNVSEKPGAVRAFMYTQDGTQIDLNSELVASLAPHATVVLKSNPGQTGNGYLGDAMPTYAASLNADGRNRLVIQGAFPACEALGLVRTPAGVLTNLTSTTYSGDATRLGAQNNGTSNTSN